METKDKAGYLLIGTYTGNEWGKMSDGIYIYRCEGGGMFSLHGTAAAINPSYITLDRKGENLYAVTESPAPSFVNSFPFDSSGGTAGPISRSRSGESDPCNILVSPDDRFVVLSDYSSGSVSIFPILPDGTAGQVRQVVHHTGTGPVKDRQEKSHIHCARYCTCGKYLFVTDLGADTIYRYNVLEGSEDHIDIATRKDFRLKPGSGPRHFVFDREGRHMYLINELSTSVTVFRFDKGEIKEIQHLTANPEGTGGDGGDIKLSPDEGYLYASVRQTANDGIAVYRRDAETGSLEFLRYQPCVLHPRNMEFSPCGRFLLVAGMKAGRVQVFSYDPADGSLADTGKGIEVPSPTCLVFTR